MLHFARDYNFLLWILYKWKKRRDSSILIEVGNFKENCNAFSRKGISRIAVETSTKIQKDEESGFVTDLLHVSLDSPNKYLNFVRYTSYNFCRIHRSREVAWERERIFFQTRKKFFREISPRRATHLQYVS